MQVDCSANEVIVARLSNCTKQRRKIRHTAGRYRLVLRRVLLYNEGVDNGGKSADGKPAKRLAAHTAVAAAVLNKKQTLLFSCRFGIVKRQGLLFGFTKKFVCESNR